jgi:four helix bundle protein
LGTESGKRSTESRARRAEFGVRRAEHAERRAENGERSLRNFEGSPEEVHVGYRRFEDLPVWNDAIELAVRLLRISQAGRLNGVGDLKSQLERAVISISNNIAEGCERGTSQELITFLYIAKGSAGEVRSMLNLLGRLTEMGDLTPHIEDLRGRTENISRQLGGWIEAVKSSDYKGHRSQNDQTRAATQAIRKRDEFLEKVREIQDQAIRQQRPSHDERPGPK